MFNLNIGDNNMNIDKALKKIRLLKSEKSILNLMKKTNYNQKVCQVGISLLKIDEMTEDQILKILEKTNHSSNVYSAIETARSDFNNHAKKRLQLKLLKIRSKM